MEAIHNYKRKYLTICKSHQKRTRNLANFPLFLLIALITTSCASIPQEAPQLSQELGTQIQELENSHLSLVKIYFDNERKEVREFIDEEWLPAFANNFFEDENIQKAWETVAVSNNKSFRHEFIVRTVPELQKVINNKYQELTDPLDRLETELMTSIRQKYSNIKSVNNTITSYLHSASDVEQNRQRYMEMVGVTDQKMTRTINEVEALTSNLTETVVQADEKLEDYKEKLSNYEEKFQIYKEKINQLLTNI